MTTDTGSADGAVDTFAVLEDSEHVPSELASRVSTFFQHLRQVHVEFRNDQGRWVTTKKKIVWTEAPTIADEEICRWLVRRAREHAEHEGGEKYQAVLTLVDPHSQKRVRKYCPLTTAVSASGDLEILDDPRLEFTPRDHLELTHKIIERGDTREDAMFERQMALLDKVNDMAERNIAMAERQSAGVAAIGDSLGKIVQASTKALDNAMSLFDRKDHETTQIKLAQLDAQAKKDQIQFAMSLVQKLGGPLMGQLSSLFGSGGTKAKATQADPKAVAAAVAAAGEASAAVAVVPAESVIVRLTRWREALTDEQKAGLKEIIDTFGDEHYTAIEAAATDEEAVAALTKLKAACDAMTETEEGFMELGTRLAALGTILGDDLSEQFGHLLPDPE